MTASTPPGLIPVANFDIDNPVVPIGTTVNFTDTSIHSPTDWSWKINGAEFSIAQNSSYYFSAPGLYDIKLTASNSFGSDSITKTVNVFTPSP